MHHRLLSNSDFKRSTVSPEIKAKGAPCTKNNTGSQNYTKQSTTNVQFCRKRIGFCSKMTQLSAPPPGMAADSGKPVQHSLRVSHRHSSSSCSVMGNGPFVAETCASLHAFHCRQRFPARTLCPMMRMYRRGVNCSR